MRLDDKDILSDCLIDSKYCSQGYHVAALESVNDQIRNTFLRLMNDEMASAKMIFDTMHQRGWYPVDMARPTIAVTQPQYGASRPDFSTPVGMRPEYTARPEASYGRPEGEQPPRW